MNEQFSQLDPRQLAQLVMAARAARQVGQGASALPVNGPGPGVGTRPFVDPQRLAQLVMAARAAQQVGQGAGASPVNNPGPGVGTGPFVDPQQLAQLVRTARAARRAQAPGAGQQSAPALPASVLGPTDPFAAGVAPQPPVLAPGPDPAKAAAIQKLRQAQANPQATQAIVDLGPQTKALSRIPRAAAVPEVKPNWGWRVNDPKRVRTTLGGLMRGKGELPPPRAARYLTQAEEQQTAPTVKPQQALSPSMRRSFQSSRTAA